MAESCKVFSPCPLDCWCIYPGVFVPPFGEQRHKGCVHSFLWIFECCPRVKLNNKNAAYLDLILLIFIELVFFFFFQNSVWAVCPWGKWQQWEMVLDHLLLIWGLWFENVAHFLNHCPFPKVSFNIQCQEEFP